MDDRFYLGVSSINQSRQLVVAGTQENTVILQHILDGSFVSREDLQKHLEEAKRRLTELKRDEIVLAKTRTVKRLLDHVKIEGSQNLSNKARDKIALSQQDGFVIGLEVTKLRDEISEKERELSGMFQASTFRYDRNLRFVRFSITRLFKIEIIIVSYRLYDIAYEP